MQESGERPRRAMEAPRMSDGRPEMKNRLAFRPTGLILDVSSPEYRLVRLCSLNSTAGPADRAGSNDSQRRRGGPTLTPYAVLTASAIGVRSARRAGHQPPSSPIPVATASDHPTAAADVRTEKATDVNVVVPTRSRVAPVIHTYMAHTAHPIRPPVRATNSDSAMSPAVIRPGGNPMERSM